MGATASEITALQILVTAGRVPAGAEWSQAVHDAGDYIIGLAETIRQERNAKQPEQHQE